MTGILGIGFLVGMAFLFSSAKKNINWRTVGGAFAIQAALGAFILYSSWGISFLNGLTQYVANVISYSEDGISFLFGGLNGNESLGFIFVINVLPVIIFFSSLIAVLYHLGIMSWVIRIIGGALQKMLGTSRPESMSAAANIFVGQTEAPLIIKPFLPTMTRSELFAVMVGGLASIAGSIMAGFAGMGIELKYLLAASFMAAPGGLMMAKMLEPETTKTNETLTDVKEDNEEYANIFDAAASGATSGMKLAVNVGAMLLAFIALIALLNGMIGGIAAWFTDQEVSIQLILGYVFQPIAWLIGVPWNEANIAGSLIGQKIVLNEFVAYVALIETADKLSPLSQAIITFALCGFANLSSIAILMGGIGALAPTRRKEIAQLGLKAVFAATLANFMSASLAGIFISLSM
ncbi:NupC/NupG family nucleoside CNT transporter [Glaciecola sp. MH2013]|uniref:NupC/NupG family nucleoside CNT transporter n=1 Tax=Glaciecola sp. MH2013 TaxID=2785524 RepID=UPI0018A01048|nr:NupC/NupG family nucleoside CNT transporter [Glaciecola sp. MH2013]MBF7071969.1 NupC/NupG family nucleoside CNT transporter [Glaciecola sp. MH2013]